MARNSKKVREEEQKSEQQAKTETQVTSTLESGQEHPQSLEAPENEEQKSEQQAKTESTKKTVKKGVITEEDERADAILKMYPNYPELYIDSKGGVFAPGTPEPVRGNAKLYNNKYHK